MDSDVRHRHEHRHGYGHGHDTMKIVYTVYIVSS